MKLELKKENKNINFKKGDVLIIKDCENEEIPLLIVEDIEFKTNLRKFSLINLKNCKVSKKYEKLTRKQVEGIIKYHVIKHLDSNYVFLKEIN